MNYGQSLKEQCNQSLISNTKQDPKAFPNIAVSGKCDNVSEFKVLINDFDDSLESCEKNLYRLREIASMAVGYVPEPEAEGADKVPVISFKADLERKLFRLRQINQRMAHVIDELNKF